MNETNETIETILAELYLVDPALREEEEALRKTLAELLASRPEAKMDETFQAELKARLLAEFPRKAGPARRRSLSFPARKAARLLLGVAAAASILVAVLMTGTAGRGVAPMSGAVAVTEPAGGVGADGEAPAGLLPLSRPIAGADGVSPAKPAAPPAGPPAAGEAAAKAAPTAPADKDDLGYLSLLPRPSVAGSKSFADTEAPLRRERAAGVVAPSVAPSTAWSAEAENRKKEEAPAELLAGRFNPDFNTEGYDRITETSFAKAVEEPLSTFSIDVDTASYANVRRFLRGGSPPPPDAVRIEELVNYFPYDYPEPEGGMPFGFHVELAPAPWNPANSLLRVALQAKRIPAELIPPSNLVFLIDVSGSMEDENKLPLLKESLKILVRRMRPEDRISIVVYAGSAGLVLEPTAGNRVGTIMEAIDGLESGGSTAGGEGIRLAYETARSAFIKGGSNRVILATDGDFNVGPSSDGELTRLIEKERKSGVFLTVLGFGMGNYQDSKMQKLADSGNGNYAYVDSLAEADKVLARQMAGTLFTVAKDVKVQIEFNPARVGEYRLIGYEKRALAARDFADDAKDAGELGAGASVTALYELTPPAGAGARTDLRYQGATLAPGAAMAGELMTLKFRWKAPDGAESSLVEKPIEIAQRDIGQTSADFRFAAAVAEWGMILRGSAYRGRATLEQVASLARGALGRDPGGYRAEFLELVELSREAGR